MPPGLCFDGSEEARPEGCGGLSQEPITEPVFMNRSSPGRALHLVIAPFAGPQHWRPEKSDSWEPPWSPKSGGVTGRSPVPTGLGTHLPAAHDAIRLELGP